MKNKETKVTNRNTEECNLKRDVRPNIFQCQTKCKFF